MRYDRCPWGPKADAIRHFHMGCLTSSAETNKDIFKMDKTYDIMSQLQRDIAGVGHNEAIDKEAEAQKQADWLVNMSAKHSKKKQ